MNKLRNIVLGIVALAGPLSISDAGLALPEFVRYGYFSCTSCHVSPGGGGPLTDYGRSFSAEKLAAFFAPNEEKALHGAVGDLPPWLVLGGNFRQIQTYVETETTRAGHWIPMQRDVDVCLHTGPVWTCGTAGIVRRAEESEDGKTTYGLRKAMARVDVGDSFMLRAGRFYPRYGLMIPNHANAVRKELGFGPNQEADQVEAAFTSERLEVALARELGRVVRFTGESEDELEAFDPGYVATAAVALGDKSRAGLSYRRLNAEAESTHSVGIFAALGLSERTYVLAEVDQKATVADATVPGTDRIQRAAVSYLRVGTELARGVVPYLLHEANVRNLKDGDTRQDTHGLGLQWFPRPHFEIDTFWGHVLIRRDSTYATAGYLLLHYYL